MYIIYYGWWFLLNYGMSVVSLCRNTYNIIISL